MKTRAEPTYEHAVAFEAILAKEENMARTRRTIHAVSLLLGALCAFEANAYAPWYARADTAALGKQV